MTLPLRLKVRLSNPPTSNIPTVRQYDPRSGTTTESSNINPYSVTGDPRYNVPGPPTQQPRQFLDSQGRQNIQQGINSANQAGRAAAGRVIDAVKDAAKGGSKK